MNAGFRLGISAAALVATATATVGVGAHAAPPPSPSHSKEQYFPLQSYRVGPYAAGGSGFFGGFIDYLNLVNTRDGGVNGVKLTWSECETEYAVERGV
jgi:branched-chain amino acid transport system substrate-binding protein